MTAQLDYRSIDLLRDALRVGHPMTAIVVNYRPGQSFRVSATRNQVTGEPVMPILYSAPWDHTKDTQPRTETHALCDGQLVTVLEYTNNAAVRVRTVDGRDGWLG